MCSEIFSRITNANVAFWGLNPNGRPENMIIKHMAVPPPSVRPSIRQDNNQRSEDDLTFSLSHITKQVKTLRDELTNGEQRKRFQSITVCCSIMLRHIWIMKFRR